MKSATNTTQKQFKHGEAREDGYIYLYHTERQGDCWASPEAFRRHRFAVAHGNAKRRAQKKKIPFNVDIDYLVDIYPKDGKCPVFGIDMEFGGEQDTSPTLDRIHPALGYVKGNVMWVSGYANTLKSFNTLDTLRTLLAFYEKLERRIE